MTPTLALRRKGTQSENQGKSLSSRSAVQNVFAESIVDQLALIVVTDEAIDNTDLIKVRWPLVQCGISRRHPRNGRGYHHRASENQRLRLMLQAKLQPLTCLVIVEGWCDKSQMKQER